MKKIFVCIIFFIFGVIFWQFAPFYFPESVNNRITDLTTSIYKVLRIRNPLDYPPPFSMFDDVVSQLPLDKCPDYKTIAQSVESWISKKGAQSSDNIMFSPYINSEDSVEGIIKWRLADNQPYAGLYAAGEFSHYIANADILNFANDVDGKRGVVSDLINKGFKIHPPMNIPFYRYPQGEGARKIGFIKGSEAYLITVIEINKEDFKNQFQMNNDINSVPYYDLKKVLHPVAIKISCAKIDTKLVNQYENFFELSHKYTNETSIKLEDLDNQLLRFTLIYPGTSTDYMEHQFYYLNNNILTLLQKTGEFPTCSIFESAKVGKGSLCFRPEKQEFDTVKY